MFIEIIYLEEGLIMDEIRLVKLWNRCIFESVLYTYMYNTSRSASSKILLLWLVTCSCL